ncbi:MAG: hypothetical protein A4S12_02225 [Proteobacteria bacterium SG_bin5]|nr:MAG: hypothetical protein A4S12_02225 [Proteobacteria bacterium SG_bin5]
MDVDPATAAPRDASRSRLVIDAPVASAWFDQQPTPTLLVREAGEVIVAINDAARALLHLGAVDPIGMSLAALRALLDRRGKPPLAVRRAYPIDGADHAYRALLLDRAPSPVEAVIAPPAVDTAEAVTRTLLVALDHANDYVVVLTPNHQADLGARKILYVNETLLRVTGFTRAELVGQRPLVLLSPRNTAERIRDMRAVLNAEQASRGDLWLRTKAGGEILVEADSTPLRDADGRIAHWLIVQRPVGEQRAQQEQVRMLLAAADRATDFLLVMTRDQDPVLGGRKIVYVNQTYLTRTGFTREEVIGCNSTQVYGKSNPPYVIQNLRDAADRGELVQADLWMRAKNGDEILVEGSAVPLRAADGTITHWLVIQRPVSEQRRAEAIMRLINERTQLIGRATTEALIDYEVATATSWWNDKFSALLGADPQGFPGSLAQWQARVVPEDRARVRANSERVVAGALDDWNIEYRFERPDGSIAVLNERGFIIRDARGAPARFIGTIIDVTERRMVEERLQQAQKLEALGQMTGGLAHDFNNLLTVIIGNAEGMIETAPGGTNLAELAATTLKAAERGAELTNRLLAFGRRQSLSPGSIDCAELLRGMRPLLRSTLPEMIRLELDPAASWPALVDPGQLEVALLNLAMNARDAMPGGGCFTLATAERVIGARDSADLAPGDYVEIACRDTGCGMSPETLRRAFDPFFTTKEVGKGTGLGLSMVYGFARQSGGTVTIATEIGRGTSVSIWLPRARRRGVAGARAADQAPRGGNETILLVEDDALVRDYASVMLRRLGYRVIEAVDGQAALAVLESERAIDLLFCDIVMPGALDGGGVGAWARERRPEVKQLFTSGYADPPTLDAGLGPILRKPYRRADLAAAVRAALDAPVAANPAAA